MTSPDSVTWIPGTEIAWEGKDFRAMCHQSMLENFGAYTIYLKIAPTQRYIDALREAGIDVEIHAVSNGSGRVISLIEDNVPIVGTKVTLPNIQAAFWRDIWDRYPFNERDNAAVPWVDISLKFVLRDPESNSRFRNSRHEVNFPSGNDLRMSIHAEGYESTGLDIMPVAIKGKVKFGKCAAPLIFVNGTGRGSAEIDFDNVGLDMLKNFKNGPIVRAFTVSLQVPPDSSPLCFRSAQTKPPRLRFARASGDYYDGRFTSTKTDLPGNAVVEIVIRDDTTGEVVGSRTQLKSTQHFLQFPPNQPSRGSR